MRLADLAGRDLTYRPVGRTREGRMPPGFHHLEVRRRVGAGDAAYRRALDAVMTFGAQRGVGLRPQATAARAAEGVDVLCRLALLPVPCRVVWALEGDTLGGFGYGTLPGHVESGEEGFLVERDGEAVYAVVRAYTRPGTLATRLAGPLARRGQRLVALGYLRAIARAIHRGDGFARDT